MKICYEHVFVLVLGVSGFFIFLILRHLIQSFLLSLMMNLSLYTCRAALLNYKPLKLMLTTIMTLSLFCFCFFHLYSLKESFFQLTSAVQRGQLKQNCLRDT